MVDGEERADRLLRAVRPVDLAEVHDEVFVALFAESAARAVVTVAPEDEQAFVAAAAEAGVPVTVIGTTGGDSVSVAGGFDVPLEELHRAWVSTLPLALG